MNNDCTKTIASSLLAKCAPQQSAKKRTRGD
jgi:hypothetical protein